MTKNKSKSPLYKLGDENLPFVPEQHKKKMALLKLVDIGVYIKGVGIRDGKFYVLAEDETDIKKE